MEELERTDNREDVFSRAIKAGKRTYFFDVKSTKDNELYVTITESKKRFDNAQGKFVFEKHKIFLYQEDFEKFSTALNEVFTFIKTGEKPIEPEDVEIQAPKNEVDFDFDDLSK